MYNCCPENSVLFEDDMMEHGDSLTKNSVSGEHGLSYIYAKCFLLLVFFFYNIQDLTLYLNTVFVLAKVQMAILYKLFFFLN